MRGYLARVPVNVPNALTLGRIGLVPVLTAMLLTGEPGPLWAAAALFAVLAATDFADGYLARSRDLVTTFGRIMDPVADKLLVGAALVSLVVVDRLALWLAVVVVVREVAVTALRWLASTRGIVIASSPIGKAKTGGQMLAIVALMLAPDPSATWVALLLAAVAAVTVASGVDYFAGYIRAVARRPRPVPGPA